MPSNYSGNPNNITTTLTASVTGTANGTGVYAGLVVISTSPTPHLFSTYDQVAITGVVGTTEANGTWYIQVIDATHFALDRSTWANAWVSGGTCTDQSLTPAFSVPNDGEAGTAGSIVASVQVLADRTQFLQLQQFRMVSYVTFASSGTVQVPSYCTLALVTMCGGGGGGGGGAHGTAATFQMAIGGSGGQGSEMLSQLMSVSPGETLVVTVGYGGTAGPAGSNGVGGGPSIVHSPAFGSIKAVGGGGGYGLTPWNGTASFDYYMPGGCGGPVPPQPYPVTSGSLLGQLLPYTFGCGGAAYASGAVSPPLSASLAGIQSNGGYAGGAGGSQGTPLESSNYFCGGGGGGGGGGPFGPGGAGGAGGNPGAIGAAGSVPASTSYGAAGGGGGGGGSATPSGFAGAAGAMGQSGYVQIVMFVPQVL